MSEQVLIGKYFHSFKKDENGKRVLQWQGRITEHVIKKTYFAEIYDWITGQDRTQILIHLSRMFVQEFEFYDSSEEMNYEYERKYSR